MNCENRGKITSFLNLGVIGGIVGKNIGTVSNCKNIAKKIEGDGVRAGGIVGENSLGSSIENSTNDGTVLSFIDKNNKRVFCRKLRDCDERAMIYSEKNN